MKVVKRDSVSWGNVPFIVHRFGARVQREFLTYPQRGVEWLLPVVFYAEMEILDYRRGRSAAHFFLRDEDGIHYTLHLAALRDVIRGDGIDPGGFVDGFWRFRKRGLNYGVEYIGKQYG